jgi:hypothetical protein
LRVADVPFTFPPDPVGGTEIYVEALAHGLQAHGIESLIVAPSHGRNEAYERNGLRVRRYHGGFESFTAGTPVIGSDLGGIAWVRHEANGLVLDPEDISARADALRRCAEDRRFLPRLRQGVMPPRTWRT